MLPQLAEMGPATTCRASLSVQDPETAQQVSIPLLLARGAEEGPVLCLVAGQRGTDVNGMAAIHVAFQRMDLSRLKGAVIAVPVANPPAARIKRAAYPTDDGWPTACPFDMNNTWPGNPQGNLTERIASAIWDACIESCHAVVDLEAALPQHGPATLVRLTSDASLACAKAFGIAHIQTTREIDQKALYDVAARQGKAALEVRLPPPGTVWPESVRLTLSGLRALLTELHMSEREVTRREVAIIVPESEVREFRAPTDGLVVSHVDPGALVQEGALIAELLSLHTAEVAAEVTAPFRGVVTLIGCAAAADSGRSLDLVSRGETFVRIARCDT